MANRSVFLTIVKRIILPIFLITLNIAHDSHEDERDRWLENGHDDLK